jgi:hypothetical protein
MTAYPDPTDWVLPPGITLQQAQANPGAQFTFPQTLTTAATAPCGSVIQRDVYNANPATVTADGVLSWVDGHPEDSALYVSHVFYETPACVVVTPSPSPTPTPPPTVTEVPVPPTPPTLAQTGANSGTIAGEVFMALGIIIVGASLVWRRYAS